MLRVEASKLESRRNPSDELDEIDVEEGRSHLQRAGHARAVDLCEDVVLEVRPRVDVDESLEPVSRRTLVVRLPMHVERIVRLKGEKRTLLPRREGAEPDRMT